MLDGAPSSVILPVIIPPLLGKAAVASKPAVLAVSLAALTAADDAAVVVDVDVTESEIALLACAFDGA